MLKVELKFKTTVSRNYSKNLLAFIFDLEQREDSSNNTMKDKLTL